MGRRQFWQAENKRETGMARGRIASVLLALPVAANAMCFAPTPPSAPFIKPSEPFCVTKYRHARQMTCEQREIDAYVSSLKDYQRELQAYSEQARAYAYHAGEYAKCEAKEAAQAQSVTTERPFRVGHN